MFSEASTDEEDYVQNRCFRCGNTSSVQNCSACKTQGVCLKCRKVDEKCEKHRNRLKLRKKTTVKTTKEKNESYSRNQEVSSEDMIQSPEKVMRSEEMQCPAPSRPNHISSERNYVPSILQEPIFSNPDTIFISDEELPTPVKPQQPIPSEFEVTLTHGEEYERTESTIGLSLSASKPRRVEPHKCLGCHSFFHQLKLHLRSSVMCLGIYKESYQSNDVNDIMRKIKNQRRQNKRDQEKTMGIKRSRQEENRQETDPKKLFQLKISSIYEIFCVFCKTLNGEERLQHNDQDLLQKEGYSKYIHKNGYYICKTCTLIRSNLPGHLSLEEQLEYMDEVYVDEMRKVVGIVHFETEEKVEKIYLPIVGNVEDDIDLDIHEERCARVMVFSKFIDINTQNEAEHDHKILHLLDKNSIDPKVLLNTLFRDFCNKVNKSKYVAQQNQAECAKGMVMNSLLITEKVEESESYLKDFRGTDAYKKHLEECTRWRANQNGHNILQINLEVFTGKLNNLALAKLLLKAKGIPSIIDDRESPIKLLVPCHENGQQTCNLHDCQNAHQNCLEAALEFFPNGIIPEEYSLLVAKFIKEFVRHYVNHIIKPNTSEYDLKLEFKNEGNVFLTGNLWVTELEESNRNNEEAAEYLILNPVLQRDIFTQTIGPCYVEDGIKICPELNQHLGVEEKTNLREGSLLEAIFCYGRGFQLRWASQSTEIFDIRNYSEESQMFKKQNDCDNEPDEIFFTDKGEAFVRVNSMRKKYTMKPAAVEHLTGGQFTHSYGKYDKRTKCYEEKKQQLVGNDGILGESAIPLLADFDKYPGKTRFLPEMILLSNGEIMKLKSKGSVIKLIGRLDHFGLGVLMEPFKNEDSLKNTYPLPSRSMLEQRLKHLFAFSDYSAEFVF